MDAALEPSDLRSYLSRSTPAEDELARMYGRDRKLTILDIGSCEGEDTIRYARRFRNARLFAFEPLPENQRLVLAQLRSHNIANAELVPLALSNRRGEAVFHVSSGCPPVPFSGDSWNYGNKSSSLLRPASDAPMHGWIEFKRTITVQTDTLAHFASQNGLSKIDFVHMDVQGAELLVLEGAGTLLHGIAAIWMEISKQPLYQGQPVKSDVQSFMERHGFKLVQELMNGVEGDHLYVNKRFPRLWLYRSLRSARLLWRSARFRAGSVKARLLKKTTLP